ncbi:hypothetical protein RF11_02726 [Thelohanellus kitauei]|uniref:Uncharacterized protein n=1 Tax=Thelohanellus kitauei TaxID=669202 RepID=A0A0C2MDT3_THEKT|nr:hypothetical protein RF11_02726 [Thelohanellus kitauei]
MKAEHGNCINSVSIKELRAGRYLRLHINKLYRAKVTSELTILMMKDAILNTLNLQSIPSDSEQLIPIEQTFLLIKEGSQQDILKQRDEWLFKWEINASKNCWDEAHQPSIIPLFLKGAVLQAYRKREETSTYRMSSSYRSFKLLMLNPGAEVNDFSQELAFLGCISEHISSNIRLVSDLSLRQAIEKAKILLDRESRKFSMPVSPIDTESSEEVCAVLPKKSQNTLEIQVEELTNRINEVLSLVKSCSI